MQQKNDNRMVESIHDTDAELVGAGGSVDGDVGGCTDGADGCAGEEPETCTVDAGERYAGAIVRGSNGEAVEEAKGCTDEDSTDKTAGPGRSSVDELIEELTLYIRRNNEDDKAYYLLGNAYRKKGDWQQALNNYLEAIERNPESPAVEARAMVMEILEFYNKDMFNQ